MEENKQELTIEEAFRELEEIAARLEMPQTTLEESFGLYRQGVELLKLCGDKLDTVEKKMLQLDEEGKLSEFQG